MGIQGERNGSNQHEEVTAKPTPTVITLASICKELKIEPRKARRILRGAKMKNPGRWSWTTKAEADKIAKV